MEKVEERMKESKKRNKGKRIGGEG